MTEMPIKHELQHFYMPQCMLWWSATRNDMHRLYRDSGKGHLEQNMLGQEWHEDDMSTTFSLTVEKTLPSKEAINVCKDRWVAILRMLQSITPHWVMKPHHLCKMMTRMAIVQQVLQLLIMWAREEYFEAQVKDFKKQQLMQEEMLKW
jgi:hypothetical protein